MDRTKVVHHTYASRPEDTQSLEASSAYSSPVSAIGSQGGFSPVGLGLSHCGMENAFGQVRLYAPSIPVPPATPSQLVPEAAAYDFQFEVDDDRSQYAIYNGLPDASESSLGVYSPTAMSASPSYNSVDLGPRQFIDTPYPAMQEDMSLGSASGQNMTSERIMTQSRTASPGTTEMDSKSIKGDCSPRSKLVSASGLECPMCGAKFTRRSNCKEHQKAHDPSWKKKHPCEECGKTFGRMADLKRHLNSVHLGIRRRK
ncbi:hypothetical protein N7522_005514 [Penicillium canescens]|uniref:uncharacterized protein n=1 Tax=Penicillium canescens TaxID=5083 RepID=UPI0026E10085|nr:uncharacterized protein N7446_010968 [Penicillium canescens]KAJ6007163.1 hypothetical protein N7522_005514 [Penicillium canescens]KAJ6048285.1 hypothetical protein N7446_010968 [Penicillium canescens]